MTAELSNKARAEVRRHRLLAIGAILIAAGTFGFLALGGLGKSLVYYWSPSELRAHGGKAEGATIRLGGLVAPGSIETGEGGLGLKFRMTDGTETVTVFTTAVPPAMFREGIGVVVEGALQADGTFATDRLMIKHDNEYQAPGKGDSRSVKQLAETLEPTAAGDPR
ncbi:MAG: cytochrome c-type biosis protein CcmE [Acidobacteriota bacterium]|nr:cytochrome c-type biosis protein CcmE [Acidobacteriota bacterium]